jgi:hypothetical protein
MDKILKWIIIICLALIGIGVTCTGVGGLIIADGLLQILEVVICTLIGLVTVIIGICVVVSE